MAIALAQARESDMADAGNVGSSDLREEPETRAAQIASGSEGTAEAESATPSATEVFAKNKNSTEAQNSETEMDTAEKDSVQATSGLEDSDIQNLDDAGNAAIDCQTGHEQEIVQERKDLKSSMKQSSEVQHVSNDHASDGNGLLETSNDQDENVEDSADANESDEGSWDEQDPYTQVPAPFNGDGSELAQGLQTMQLDSPMGSDDEENHEDQSNILSYAEAVALGSSIDSPEAANTSGGQSPPPSLNQDEHEHQEEQVEVPASPGSSADYASATSEHVPSGDDDDDDDNDDHDHDDERANDVQGDLHMENGVDVVEGGHRGAEDEIEVSNSVEHVPKNGSTINTDEPSFTDSGESNVPISEANAPGQNIEEGHTVSPDNDHRNTVVLKPEHEHVEENASPAVDNGNISSVKAQEQSKPLASSAPPLPARDSEEEGNLVNFASLPVESESKVAVPDVVPTVDATMEADMEDAPRIPEDDDEAEHVHIQGDNIMQSDIFGNINASEASRSGPVYSGSAPENNEGHTGASVVSGGISEEDATTSSVFQFDSAKPWYMFGRGTVDTSGASGAPAWEPDASKSECTLCRSKFDFFRRRHHCRMDGKIYCKNCCNQFRLLPAQFGVREPQRVCNTCCTKLDPLQDELAATISNATRELGRSGGSAASGNCAPGAHMGSVSSTTSDESTQHSQSSSLSSPGALLGGRVNISSPVSFSMSAEIMKAANAVDNFFGTSQQSMLRDEYIPAMLLKQAKGIAFLTVVKMGFVVTTRFGTGLVVGRDRHGSWTAPSAIGLAGFGWGAQMGGEVTDFVIILNTESAVDAFSGNSQVALGSQLSLAAGPLGRTGEASVNVSMGGESRIAPSYTYSQSKGLFVGISLEGAVIRARADVNERFYGKHYDPKDILGTRVPRPKAAEPLYEALQRACERDTSAGNASPMGVTRAPLVDEI